MNLKSWLGWGLLVWGGVGVVNNFMIMQAMSSGGAPTAALNTIDPATVLQVGNPQGVSLTSPSMLLDAGIAAAGAWLLFG